MLDHPDSGGVQTGWLNRLIHHRWFTDNKPSYTYLIFQLNDQSLTGAAAAVLLNYSSSYLHIVGRSVVRVQTIWIIVVLSGNSMETYESSWVFPRRTQWRRVLEVSRLLISCLLSLRLTLQQRFCSLWSCGVLWWDQKVNSFSFPQQSASLNISASSPRKHFKGVI